MSAAVSESCKTGGSVELATAPDWLSHFHIPSTPAGYRCICLSVCVSEFDLKELVIVVAWLRHGWQSMKIVLVRQHLFTNQQTYGFFLRDCVYYSFPLLQQSWVRYVCACGSIWQSNGAICWVFFLHCSVVSDQGYIDFRNRLFFLCGSVLIWSHLSFSVTCHCNLVTILILWNALLYRLGTNLLPW